MRLLPLALASSPALALIAGCADWPRWSHEADPGDALDAPADPRELVERDWEAIAEEGDFPDGSVGVVPVALDLERGLDVVGQLSGLGWNDLGPVAREIAPGCNETGAPRHPEAIPGEWSGDVDVVVVTAEGGGHLCASLATGSAEAGWDLLLARLDPCGVPAAFAEGDDGPLGWNRGGEEGGWIAPLEPGATYAVTLAAYWPTAPDAEVDYRLTLALTPLDDGSGLCPLPPAEGT